MVAYSLKKYLELDFHENFVFKNCKKYISHAQHTIFIISRMPISYSRIIEYFYITNL